MRKSVAGTLFYLNVITLRMRNFNCLCTFLIITFLSSIIRNLATQVSFLLVCIYTTPHFLPRTMTDLSVRASKGTVYAIKGSIEPTHGSVCSDVRKLQSMDVLKLQSTKADWNTKCPFHILAYIYSNLLDISTSYFIKILSYRERLDVDS